MPIKVSELRVVPSDLGSPVGTNCFAVVVSARKSEEASLQSVQFRPLGWNRRDTLSAATLDGRLVCRYLIPKVGSQVLPAAERL